MNSYTVVVIVNTAGVLHSIWLDQESADIELKKLNKDVEYYHTDRYLVRSR